MSELGWYFTHILLLSLKGPFTLGDLVGEHSTPWSLFNELKVQEKKN